jgi:hypothetical protein
LTQDERSLPALAGLQASVAYGLLDFRAADAGYSAGFRNRKPFALQFDNIFEHFVILHFRSR